MLGFKKLGLVFCPDGSIPQMLTHASNPVAVPLGNDTVRVYFGSRDSSQKTSIWHLDLFLKGEIFKVMSLASCPVLEPGALGTFDDSGVSIGCILPNGPERFLFYMGWNLGVTVPWRNSIGLAVDSGSNNLFEKYAPAPIVDRSKYDPFTISYPCVIQDGEIWRMWYGSNLSWGSQQSDMNHVIKYAWSKNLIDWNVEGKISLNLRLPEEYALCRPWVVKENGVFKMWFCYRGESYRIGYAESLDGIEFERKPGNVVGVSDSGWDSEMVSYPSILNHQGDVYMFYNGNHYGKSGFGVALATGKAA